MLVRNVLMEQIVFEKILNIINYFTMINVNVFCQDFDCLSKQTHSLTHALIVAQVQSLAEAVSPISPLPVQPEKASTSKDNNNNKDNKDRDNNNNKAPNKPDDAQQQSARGALFASFARAAPDDEPDVGELLKTAARAAVLDVDLPLGNCAVNVCVCDDAFF
jgi:hypothetical protein